MRSLPTDKLFTRLPGLVIAFLVWGFLFTAVYAHGTGVFLENVVGDYTLDIGYRPEVLLEDTQVRFDFSIYDNQTNQEINFSEVWIRIEKNDKLLFAGGLHKARFGATGLSYNFIEAGDYKVTTRFSGATSTLAETQFDFSVFAIEVPLKDQLWFKTLLLTSIPWFIITASLIVYLIFRKKKEPSDETKPRNAPRWLRSALNIALFVSFVAVGYLAASKASYLFDSLKGYFA